MESHPPKAPEIHTNCIVCAHAPRNETQQNGIWICLRECVSKLTVILSCLHDFRHHAHKIHTTHPQVENKISILQSGQPFSMEIFKLYTFINFLLFSLGSTPPESGLRLTFSRVLYPMAFIWIPRTEALPVPPTLTRLLRNGSTLPAFYSTWAWIWSRQSRRIVTQLLHFC